MVTCKNCNSTSVKEYDMNFARRKKEGEPTAKAGLPQYQFQCQNCQNIWDSDPQAYKIYFEYADLKSRTTPIARVGKSTGTYAVHYTKPEERARRKELAKQLFDQYRFSLKLEPNEWFDIKQDAQS